MTIKLTLLSKASATTAVTWDIAYKLFDSGAATFRQLMDGVILDAKA
jgi:hypothetical protein